MGIIAFPLFFYIFYMQFSMLMLLLLVAGSVVLFGYWLSHVPEPEILLFYTFAFAKVGFWFSCIWESHFLELNQMADHKMRRKFIQTDSKYSIINNREHMN